MLKVMSAACCCYPIRLHCFHGGQCFIWFVSLVLDANIYFSDTDVTNELKHWRLDGSDEELRSVSFLCCLL